MASKGLKTFTGDEASNLLAGQCAAYYWHPAGVTASSRTITCGEGDLVNVDFIFAIKAHLSTLDSEVVARSLIGDHLSTDGTYDTTKPLDMIVGDIIYGCFDKVFTNGDGVILYLKMK